MGVTEDGWFLNQYILKPGESKEGIIRLSLALCNGCPGLQWALRRRGAGCEFYGSRRVFKKISRHQGGTASSVLRETQGGRITKHRDGSPQIRSTKCD